MMGQRLDPIHSFTGVDLALSGFPDLFSLPIPGETSVDASNFQNQQAYK
jgi:hypothetical protein